MGSRGGREFCYGAGCRNEELPGDAVAAELDGFVGILRQLGDLAQLAAEVFQGLHDQSMAVSARGRHLALRLKLLDADLLSSPLHKHSQDYSSSSIFFCHKDHRLFVASNIDRVHWRANLVLKRGVVAGGNNSIPSFISDCIERCRGPPKLSLLDKYDADGEGACLKRYTNPSFFRSDCACSTMLIQDDIQMTKKSPKETKPTFQCSEESRPPMVAAQCSDSIPEIDASQGFLSMFRQLKYRQANGSLRPQMHNFQHEATPEGNKSSNRSTESSIKETEDITVGIASVSEEGNWELERTSSLEAWLSPNAQILQQDQIAEEMSHYICNNGFVSPNDAIGATNKANCKEDSNTYKNKSVSKRSKYKGGMEFIASRVSSFPRKLFTKKHDPHPLSVADSFRNMTSKILELKFNCIRDNDSYDLGPSNTDEPSSPQYVLALAEVASDEESTECTQEKSDTCVTCYDALLDEELHKFIVHQERNGSSVPKLCSPTSVTQEESADPTPGNACAELGPREDMVPPLPPVQWLSSVKVRSGSRVASPKLKTLRPQSPAVNYAAGSNYVHPVKEQLETDNIQATSNYSILASHTEIAHTSPSDAKSTAEILNRDGISRDGFAEKYSEEIHHQEKVVVKPSEGEILKTMKVCEPTEHSDENRPELSEIKLDPQAEVQSQREGKHQIGNGDSGSNNKHNLRLPTEKLGESYEDMMGKEISAARSNAPQVDVQNSPDHPSNEERNTNVHTENVFFSAVEQLTKMNPPPVPRPKYSLLQVGFQDRSTVQFFFLFLSEFLFLQLQADLNN